MQPLQFRPILKRIRWGDRRLGTVLGKPIGEGNDYAESWEIADCGPDQSIVASGPFAGWTLSRLLAAHPVEILGRHRDAKHFPLLIKFLDASDRLSVQVHPNDEQARRMGRGENGKTEAWIILDAHPGSLIYAGLKRGVDRRTLSDALDNGTVVDCLHTVAVNPGDCIFVPAGTVHAIGEGILLAEIQQSSDVTFRLFDWGRLGPNGQPRALHREEAMACIDFDRGPIDPIGTAEQNQPTEELVRCDYFVIRRHTLSNPLELAGDDRFRILMPIAGTIDVRTHDDRRRITVGSTLLVPAAASVLTITPVVQATILETYLP
jgi:mannose-6-phosphate isomerase